MLVENLLASVSQHQRQKNAEQTLNRMRARAMNGYWPFMACVGFRHITKPGEGRILVRNEPVASIIQEGLEGYASGRFQLQAEVKRFFESQPAFPKQKGGVVTNQTVKLILTKPLYAGYIEVPDWGVSLRKGKHEGLISFEAFERIQRRLKEGSYAPTRADLNSDFPLRGTVACGDCGKALTACWSKSKTGVRHAYYLCFGTGCPRKGKSIRRERLEGEFETLLERLTPTRRLFDLARALFRDAWDRRSAQAHESAQAVQREIAKTETQIATLLDRIVDASSSSVIGAYEKRIAELERSKLVLDERRESAKPSGTFDELFELAMSFLSSPSKIWTSGKLEHQKLVLRLTFADRLAWSPETGFRTPQITTPFRMLDALTGPKEAMAERVSLELTSSGA